MYSKLEITPPFFEIGPKAYAYGKPMLELARHADQLGAECAVQVIVTPQCVDIPLLASNLKRVLVFAQHMDSLPIGRGVGSILPEAVKAAGAVGVLLNHVEKRLSSEELARTIKRADEVGLATMVCADNAEDAAAIARMEPNIIIAESPQLIGGGKRGADDQHLIARLNQIIWDINPQIRVLHGAGIASGQDVYDIIAAGAQGTGSSSGIFTAPDPLAMTAEMIRAVRAAWADVH